MPRPNELEEKKRSQKSSEMTRIQFDVAEEKLRKLEDLMVQASIRTKKELIDNALSLLAWAIRETAAGRVIASIDEDEQKYREIILPALENVATTQKQPI